MNHIIENAMGVLLIMFLLILVVAFGVAVFKAIINKEK